MAAASSRVAARYLGLDLGAETIKIVELTPEGATFRVTRRARIEHRKEPCPTLCASLASWDWEGVAGAAVTGRFSRQVELPRVPIKQTLASGSRYLLGTREPGEVERAPHGQGSGRPLHRIARARERYVVHLVTALPEQDTAGRWRPRRPAGVGVRAVTQSARGLVSVRA